VEKIEKSIPTLNFLITAKHNITSRISLKPYQLYKLNAFKKVSAYLTI
jgi:hypothetical protein